MGFRFKGLAFERVGVVGSGQIGPDIALYFAKALHEYGVSVVVVDVSGDALARGRSKLEQKVTKGRESGAFSPAAAEAILSSVTFTTDDESIRGAGLIVEAATENLDVKRRIFARLEDLTDPAAILASNSSHIEPDEIFTGLRHQDRALVIHYFFPAERNPLVEIVPSRHVGDALVRQVMALYEAIGKVPVRVASRYGYAVNPVFEGLFLAAALAVEAGLGTTKEVDIAARGALGLGVGPFTAMNLTGGNPITDHALDEMHLRFGAWWRSPALMKEAMSSGRPWDVAKRDERVSIPEERERRIVGVMQGAYLGLVGQILDTGIITPGDMELAVEVGLVMRPPLAFMNELGVDRALLLVEAYAADHPGFPVPRFLVDQARTARPFPVEHVVRRDDRDVAVLTIRRPQVLNALSDDVYAELYDRFAALRDDPAIAAVVLTGFGTKAFVSGADVKFLSSIDSPQVGLETSERSKRTGDLIEHLGKPVICALNGFAMGGGNELAMCCSARLVKKGLKLAVSQPEANLGIIPGAGATQRLPRLVGVERAAGLLRTGRGLSSREAVECGLAREEVEGDVVEAAVSLARAAARGDICLTTIDPAPLDTPASVPPVDIGHLSRAIDALLCRAVIEGCRKPLAQGLRFESELFGACCATEDMRIGVRNFLENGPLVKAVFVHR